jgi:hypothetical protein
MLLILRIIGRREMREAAELESLKEKYPDSQIYPERYLRDANGKIVRDPVTGEA